MCGLSSGNAAFLDRLFSLLWLLVSALIGYFHVIGIVFVTQPKNIIFTRLYVAYSQQNHNLYQRTTQLM